MGTVSVCFGFSWAGKSQLDEEDISWCGHKLRKEVFSTLPFVVRALPITRWTTMYTNYNKIINAIAGPVDYLYLEEYELSRHKNRFGCHSCLLS
jgi:hypothetical protein